MMKIAIFCLPDRDDLGGGVFRLTEYKASLV